MSDACYSSAVRCEIEDSDHSGARYRQEGGYSESKRRRALQIGNMVPLPPRDDFLLL